MFRSTVVAILAAACAGGALAQSYPAKPVRLMLGYTAGGSAEAGARPLARALEPLLGQPLVFEYRPGNAGGVAMEAIARAPADGYLLYYFDSGPLTVAPHLAKVGYDPIQSFTHLGHVCGSGSLLVVHPSTPFRTVNDIITESKKEPDKWSYGTSGVGGPHHLSGEYFKSVTGAKLLHVPYKGGGPAMTDLMGGQIPMLFSSLGPAVGAVKSGKDPRSRRHVAAALGRVSGRADDGRSRPQRLRFHRLVRDSRSRGAAGRGRDPRDAGAGESRLRQGGAGADQCHGLRCRDPDAAEDHRKGQGRLAEVGPGREGSEHQAGIAGCPHNSAADNNDGRNRASGNAFACFARAADEQRARANAARARQISGRRRS